MAFSGNMKKRMKRADKVQAAAAVILGDDELARGVVQVKMLDTGDQSEIGMDGLPAWLAKQLG